MTGLSANTPPDVAVPNALPVSAKAAMLPTVLLGVAVALAAIDPDRLGDFHWIQPLALAAASVTAAYHALHGLGPPRVTGPCLFLTAWLAWAAVGAALSPQPGTSLLAVGCFAAIGLSAAVVASRQSVRHVMYALAVAGALSIVAGTIMAIAGGDGGISGRFELLFLEPNQLARAAALVLVVGASFWLHEVLETRDPSRLIPVTLVALVAAAALLLTESRTGVAAATVGLVIVIGAQLSPRLSIATIAIVGLVLTGLAGVIMAGGAGDSINQQLSRSDSQPTNELRTLNGRTVLWPEIVDVARATPVSGVGLGRDRAVVSRFRAEGRVVWTAEHTHSLPLQLWLTTGIAGLIAVAAAIVGAARNAWRLVPSVERTLVLGVLAVVLVDGIVEPVLRVPSFAWVAVVAAAVLSAD